jgi:sterol desaturase/sphingolipid hydroxylase (fatty acid hydroxylase superfamily)
LSIVSERTAIAMRQKHLPDWWPRFFDAHPALPNVIAVAGLVTIMFMLAPWVTHPDGNGVMIDSLGVVIHSNTMLGKVVALRAAYRQWVPQEIRDYAREILFNPVLYFIVPFFLFLEYLFPSDPSQPLIGKGFLQDFAWFVAAVPTRILFLGVMSGWMHTYYERHLSFLTISSAEAWPRFAQIMAAFFVTEFVFYVSHFIRHKCLGLWFFHAVHHSQQELNAFTDDRVHFVDHLVTLILMFIPFYVFQVPNLFAVAVVGLYVSIHTRFVHTNVKTNLGWLGWIVASPQFHRIHHSADPSHYDRNFGVTLSLFDHLLGTAHPSRDVYPATGINDARFPTEEKKSVLRLPGNLFRQTIFPFLQLVRRLFTRRVPLATE